MSAKIVHADARIRIYEGKAEEWEGDEHIDLVFTNPYGFMPKSLAAHPHIIHQWVHRKAEAEHWSGNSLQLASVWNAGREAFWFNNWPCPEFDVSAFKPEPGGWYPEWLVRNILQAVDTGKRPFTIWDGFMGRGTTAKICRELGINFVGVEELPKHIEIAREYLGLK